MNQGLFTVAVVEEDVHLSLVELCRVCRASEEQVRVWVFEGVLEPVGASPPEWRFTGASLRRARLALTLTQELEVNPPGVALALDLLDEIAALRAGQRRAGAA
ncbi:MAG: chaperone modulator CbpM [Burkholderiaceae bacterium]